MNTLDWAIVGLFTLLTMLHGLWFGRRQKDLSEFYYASAGFSWFPVGLSIMITAFSAINLVAFSGEIVQNGLYVALSLPVLPFICLWVIRHFLPHPAWHQGESLFTLLQRRHSRRLRRLAALIFLCWKLLWIALVIYVPSRLLALMTKLPLPLFILATTAVVTGYTLSGGLRAVIWSDLLQAILVLGALLGALGYVWSQLGESPLRLLAMAHDGGLFRPFSPYSPDLFSPDPTLRITLWSSWLGSAVIFLSRYIADQSAIQRYRAMNSLRQRTRAIHLSWISTLLVLVVVSTMAVLLHHHSLLHPGQNRQPLALLAHFTASLPHGLTGFIIVALLAATFSSVDSGLHAITQIWREDLQRPARQTDQNAVRSVRRIVLMMGTAAALIAHLLPYVGTVFEIIVSLVNALGGPLLGLLLPSLFWPGSREKGLFWGGILAVGVTLILGGSGGLLSLHYVGVIGLAIPMLTARLGKEEGR